MISNFTFCLSLFKECIIACVIGGYDMGPNQRPLHTVSSIETSRASTDHCGSDRRCCLCEWSQLHRSIYHKVLSPTNLIGKLCTHFTFQLLHNLLATLHSSFTFQPRHACNPTFAIKVALPEDVVSHTLFGIPCLT